MTMCLCFAVCFVFVYKCVSPWCQQNTCTAAVSVIRETNLAPSAHINLPLPGIFLLVFVWGFLNVSFVVFVTISLHLCSGVLQLRGCIRNPPNNSKVTIWLLWISSIFPPLPTPAICNLLCKFEPSWILCPSKEEPLTRPLSLSLIISAIFFIEASSSFLGRCTFSDIPWLQPDGLISLPYLWSIRF